MAAYNVSDTTLPSHLLDFSLVFSVTMLLVSAIFGSGMNALILITIFMSKSLRKLRCALFVTLLFANAVFGFVWVPLEIVQLFHYKLYNYMSDGLRHATHALYIFVISVIACALFAISVQSLLILSSKRYRSYRRKIVFAGAVGSWAVATVVTIVYVSIAFGNDGGNQQELYHLMLHAQSFHAKISVFTIYVVSLMIMLFVTALRVRARQSSMSDCVEFSSSTSSSAEPNEASVCLPTIEEPDTEDVDADRVSQKQPECSPSPRVKPKCKEDDNVSQVGILPPQNKSRKNSLTINFGNVLSRRRHTICQIGDTGPQFSPVERAKQYNYVRKFSVDVMALQAQLENPKVLGKERTFLSQQELSKNDEDTNSVRKSGTSLASIREDEDHVEHNDGPSDVTACVDPGMNEITAHLTRKQSAAMRNLQLRLRVVKCAAFMIAAFLLTMLPVYVTETLRGNIKLSSYINVITYTTAVSALQSLLYPQFILCMDSRIKDKLRCLARRVRDRLSGRPKHEIHITAPDEENGPCHSTQC